ncbi:Leucine-rich repeat-containing protein 7 [Bulinus truncatus]|nr:Leucine-rich repeat-containing protein 7 [Bulinus truncatus]
MLWYTVAAREDMAGIIVKKCPCLRPKIEEEVKVLDYRHSSLHDVPSEVFNRERTLEVLYCDSNQIRDLPRELFYCHGLRHLSISDNEVTTIPPAISSLGNLEELDFSKNGKFDLTRVVQDFTGPILHGLSAP